MIDGTSAIKVVKRPELITVGDRKVSTFGWRQDLAEDHLKGHLGQEKKRWCAVECMARTMFGRNTDFNRAAVRKRIAPLFRSLVERGMFLVKEYDDTPRGRGKITAFKLYETETDDVQATQYALSQVERMRKRGEHNEETLQRAVSILRGQSEQ